MGTLTAHERDEGGGCLRIREYWRDHLVEDETWFDDVITMDILLRPCD